MMKTCPQCGYQCQGWSNCPSCNSELELEGWERLLKLFTNTWTGQLLACGGCLTISAVAVLLVYLFGR